MQKFTVGSKHTSKHTSNSSTAAAAFVAVGSCVCTVTFVDRFPVIDRPSMHQEWTPMMCDTKYCYINKLLHYKKQTANSHTAVCVKGGSTRKILFAST